jgi:hypothetical protein
MIKALATKLRRRGRSLDRLMGRNDWRQTVAYICSVHMLMDANDPFTSLALRCLRAVTAAVFTHLWVNPVGAAKTVQTVLFERGWIEQAMYVNTVLAHDQAKERDQ